MRLNTIGLQSLNQARRSVFDTLLDKDKTKIMMGLIVESLREDLGMSCYTLAKESGVDYSWLHRFEKGKSGIRMETLILLAKGLKIFGHMNLKTTEIYLHELGVDRKAAEIFEAITHKITHSPKSDTKKGSTVFQ